MHPPRGALTGAVLFAASYAAMRHQYETRQWVPFRVETVFDFFSNPANLPPLMPRWQCARITRAHIVPPAPPAGRMATGHEAGAGSTMRIRFRPFPGAPFTVAWDARIAEFAWDDHFCDTQERSPLRYWRHCHHLRAAEHQGRAGTLVTDEVTLSFPLGPLGEWAWRLSGRRQIASIFRFRQRQLLRLLARDARRQGA